MKNLILNNIMSINHIKVAYYEKEYNRILMMTELYFDFDQIELIIEN